MVPNIVSGTRSCLWQRGQFKMTSAIEDRPVTVCRCARHHYFRALTQPDSPPSSGSSDALQDPSGRIGSRSPSRDLGRLR